MLIFDIFSPSYVLRTIRISHWIEPTVSFWLVTYVVIDYGKNVHIINIIWSIITKPEYLNLFIIVCFFGR